MRLFAFNLQVHLLRYPGQAGSSLEPVMEAGTLAHVIAGAGNHLLVLTGSGHLGWTAYFFLNEVAG